MCVSMSECVSERVRVKGGGRERGRQTDLARKMSKDFPEQVLFR